MEQDNTIEERLDRIEKLLIGQKSIFTLEEVATYTSLSKSHLYKLTSTGNIPFYKPQGKFMYFEKSEIDSWLLRNKHVTNEEIEAAAASHVTLNPRKSYNK